METISGLQKFCQIPMADAWKAIKLQLLTLQLIKRKKKL